MRSFSTSIVFFVLVVSAYGFELLRSGLRFQDGRTVIYRFEVPDRAVSPTVGREKASQTAINWASTFYRAPDLDILDVGSRNTPINFWLVSMIRGSDRQTVYAVILGDGSIVEPMEDHTTPYEDLMTLAHRKFTEFASDVERKTFEKLFQDIHDGQRADFTPELSAVMSPQEVRMLTDPVNAGRWCKIVNHAGQSCLTVQQSTETWIARAPNLMVRQITRFLQRRLGLAGMHIYAYTSRTPTTTRTLTQTVRWYFETQQSQETWTAPRGNFRLPILR